MAKFKYETILHPEFAACGAENVDDFLECLLGFAFYAEDLVKLSKAGKVHLELFDDPTHCHAYTNDSKIAEEFGFEEVEDEEIEEDWAENVVPAQETKVN